MYLVEKLKKRKNQLEKLLKQTNICKNCFKDIQISNIHHFLNGDQKVCNKCLSLTDPYFKVFKFEGIRSMALFPYNEQLKNMIYLLKGCKDFEIRECLLSMFVNELKILYRKYCIVCAPSFEEKNKERGFNHVEAIFSQLCLEKLDLLEKTKDISQHTLKLNKRKNISEIIQLKENPPSLKGKKILIVDDIMTTGGTMKRCVELIKSLNPKKIQILVVAKRELSKEEKKLYEREALDYI